jgi:hypothetical protein
MTEEAASLALLNFQAPNLQGDQSFYTGFSLLNLLHDTIWLIEIRDCFILKSGPGSSVGIATGYGLDGPGIESRWGRDFSHKSRPALGPTQPPVQWVPGRSRR